MVSNKPVAEKLLIEPGTAVWASDLEQVSVVELAEHAGTADEPPFTGGR
jgi:hypothetical protein